MLTEDTVLLPGLLQEPQDFPYVMPHAQYDVLKGRDYGEIRPLPNLGEVAHGSSVQVQQMYTYSDFNATTRHGKLQFTDRETGERLTAYSNWEYVEVKLIELK